MVDVDKIRQKISFMETNISRLTILQKEEKAIFLEDFRNVDAAKNLLQISIKAMIDICDHIIARQRLGTPEASADSFRILAENGLLSKDNVSRYAVMTKFRNKVVHVYSEIKDEEIYNIVQSNIMDFKMFIAEIVKMI